MIDSSIMDRELLREYIDRQSDGAFTELARRHAGWIYSTARRQAGEHAADDLTQAVLLVLAQKPKVAIRHPVLSAWLFGVLRFAVLRWRRDEARRLRHEQVAAELAATKDSPAEQQCLPMLDELLTRLREKDRRAILVRFYERKSLAESAAVLGISEEAARKRVARAIEKLRHLFATHGITSTSELLSALLMQHATMPHPISVSTAERILKSTCPPEITRLSKGTMHMMAIQKATLLTMSLAVFAIVLGGGWAGYTLSQSSPPPASLHRQVSTLQSPNTLIAISPDGRHISGYSVALGKWTPLKLDEAATAELQHRNSGERFYGFDVSDIAVFEIGDRAYGYSPATGTWDTITVKNLTNNDLSTTVNTAMIQHNAFLAIFSVNTGKWAVAQWEK